MKADYSKFLYIAIRAALDAGKAIMDVYTDPNSDFEVEIKADNSPLTKADKRAHNLISVALSVTPYPILSEEGKEIPFKERSEWETFWIVDPLDGTKEFIKKIRICKTLDEERYVVNKECVEIQNLNKNCSDKYSLRSLAK